MDSQDERLWKWVARETGFTKRYVIWESAKIMHTFDGARLQWRMFSVSDEEHAFCKMTIQYNLQFVHSICECLLKRAKWEIQVRYTIHVHCKHLVSGYRIILKKYKKSTWKYVLVKINEAKIIATTGTDGMKSQMLDILSARTGELAGRGHSVDTGLFTASTAPSRRMCKK